MSDLFDALPSASPTPHGLAPGALHLPAYVDDAADLLLDLLDVAGQAPFRHLVTRFGGTMSVAMTNCGRLGWTSDRRGYRYVAQDPLTGLDWPAMPPRLLRLARHAAAAAGHDGFEPDACLVNRYVPGARMALHQDRDEPDLSAPIVSVSLGLPATFLFGGLARADRPRRVRLMSGDVVVWGGASRLAYHGVAPLGPGSHPLTGAVRYNLTFRVAGRD